MKTGLSGFHAEFFSGATKVRVARPAEPPPVADYQAWLETHYSATQKKQRGWDGRKLRRAVVMKRNGCSNGEIAESVRLSNHNVCTTLSALPPELHA